MYIMRPVRFDKGGNFMATMSDQGEVFFYHASLSIDYKVIGYKGTTVQMICHCREMCTQ